MIEKGSGQEMVLPAYSLRSHALVVALAAILLCASVAVSGCATTVVAPPPAATMESEPVAPENIHPLTVDQNAMLDG